MNYSIIFCGSPEFACLSLKALTELNTITIKAVFSQPDKVRKRGSETTPTPLKAFAQSLSINTYTPESKSEFSKLVKEINPDIIVVVAYGMILPNEIINTYFTLNSHASLLPKYRGASPIQASLLNNEAETGITLIKLTEKMDTGPILSQKSFAIHDHDYFKTVHDSLANLSAELLKEWFTNLNLQTVTFHEQEHELATYCKKISKDELYLNPKDSSDVNFSKIRAFSPLPGAYTLCDQKRVKIISAILKDGTILPTQVKPEGKKLMTYEDYKLGYQKDIHIC